MRIFICRDLAFIIFLTATVIFAGKTVTTYMTLNTNEYLHHLIAALVSLLTLMIVDSAFSRRIRTNTWDRTVR